jgi:uracil-DNA glycosylase
MSHADLGWQDLTGQALRMLVKHRDRMVFMLWGNQAKQALFEAIPPTEQWMLHRHLILRSAHPSPRSAPRGFLGSRPFSTANDWLNANKIAPIWWCLP